jgi:hypothetical protein
MQTRRPGSTPGCCGDGSGRSREGKLLTKLAGERQRRIPTARSDSIKRTTRLAEDSRKGDQKYAETQEQGGDALKRLPGTIHFERIHGSFITTPPGLWKKVYPLVTSSADEPNAQPGKPEPKMLSAPSSLSGSARKGIPGPGDTACCGSAPGMASGCAGPGSCCGKGST